MRVTLHKVSLPNGETLAYREREGGRHPLLLIHGNMTSSQHWDVVLENLDSRYKVYAVDMRGFGHSSYHRPIESLKELADDLVMWMDQIKLDSCSVLGWSTGGGVAMQMAADYPERVQKLILLASLSTRGYPFYPLDEAGRPLLNQCLKTKEEIARDPSRTLPVLNAYQTGNKAFLKQLWDALIYNRSKPDPEQYERYLDDMLTQRNLVDIYYANNLFNISHKHNGLVQGSGAVDRIQGPVLVLWGEEDLVVSEAMIQEIMEDLGEKARLVRLKRCGHSPLIDDLETFLEEVNSFLEES